MNKDQRILKPIPSPCISKCKMGLDSLCEGCHRSIAEIMDWPYLSDEKRLALMKELISRKK